MRWIAVLALVAVACVSVDATRIRKGLYAVNVRGNAIGGLGEAVTAAHRRAAQLCPDGYDIEDSASGSTSAYLRTSYGIQQVRKPEITIVVRCNMPAPSPAAASAAPPGAVARWWCTTFLAGRLGACFRSPAACGRQRESASTIDSTVSSCVPSAVAVCFGVAYHGQEGSDDMCQPDQTTCTAQRVYALEHPEQTSVLTECRPID